MNTPVELRRRDALLAVLSLLGACGGVDSGGTGTGASSTYANGPITGLGSIILGGVRYDDANANVEDDDGRTRSRAELRLGMRTEVLASTVTVAAGVSTATANLIRMNREIVGPVDAVDIARGRLIVLGQTVSVVATTVFDSAIANGIASLLPGDLLEIYAELDVVGARYVASRIDRRSSATAYKLRGPVGSLSMAARTMTLGPLTIDWSAVAPSDPAAALSPGRFVRVTLATTPTAGIWRATAISGGQAALEDREFAEVEGRITALTSQAAFVVNGLPVDASAASSPGALALGVKVEVRGSLRGGVLVATRVELEQEGGGSEPFELHGVITAVDAAAMRFVVRGITVSWNAATRFDSSSAADIQVGRQVETRGPLSADGLRIEATLVHVEL